MFMTISSDSEIVFILAMIPIPVSVAESCPLIATLAAMPASFDEPRGLSAWSSGQQLNTDD